MSTPLLTTKLYVPPIRAELVPRPRLVERLRAGLDRRLTLISAPAGFGKTTLLTEYVAHCDRDVVWLSLDEGDNDPAQFLRYLIATLQQLDASVGQGALSLLHSPQLPSGRGLAIQLINDISALPDPFILVLDDYQAVRRVEIHEMLDFLIDHQPPQMHTIIATRRDPRLSLARWRARGELAEIRTPDLRFTAGEASHFLNQRMGLDLTLELVEALEDRTEGWITGLQLAAVALQGTASQRGSQDAAAFVQEFSGSDRYIMDYLVGEVLQRQPAHVRHFLQQTACLPELSAPLCNFVTGLEDSAATLQEVERANLFLIPLDSRREWYRYHHLFAEVLTTAVDEEQVQALHRRAAAWYEAHSRLPSAIRHALAGGDLESGVRLIKIAAPEQLQQGGFVRVLFWLDAVPDHVVRADPDLATFKCYSLLWRGEAAAARSYADAAEQSLTAEAPAVTRGRYLTLRAHLCPDKGPKVLAYANEAIELLDESTPFFYGAALLLLALGHKASGNVTRMMEVFRDLARLEEQRNPFLAALAFAEMADVLRLQGRRREALVLCQRAIERYSDGQGRPLPSLTVVLLLAAMLAYEANELAPALQRAAQSAETAQQTGMSIIAFQGNCYVEVPCRWALGERAEAWAALQQARELLDEAHPLYREASLDAPCSEAWLNLKEGNIKAAARWADTLDFGQALVHYDRSHIYLTYVRVLLAQGRSNDAEKVLRRLETWARTGGWERVLLSVGLMRAIAAYQSGDEPMALDHLAQALDLAAAENYRRVFLDEGPVVLELLPRLRPRFQGMPAQSFVDGLLVDFASEGYRREGDMPASSPPPQPLPVELLTERELEVLRLLAEGLTTPEIANRLYISAGTAKWHTINIYRKLDVHNRVQAVTCAREWGMI